MSHILDPLTIHSLRLSNRLVLPPMATAKASPEGRVTQAVLDWYAQKCPGLGLVIAEHAFVLPEGRAGLGQLSVASDETLDGLGRLGRVIHEAGSACALQISHAGSRTSPAISGSRPRAPSAVAHPASASGDVPQELDRMGMATILEAFTSGARRAKVAGFDAVELHAAHGYLLDQFLSPLTNRRTDLYGGSLVGRILFLEEVVRAVRRAVGPGYPIFVRLGVADFLEGGLSAEEGVEAAARLVAAGTDLIDVSGGFGYALKAPEGYSGQGFLSPLSRAVKAAVKVPVILTGGVTEAEAAAALLEAGAADLIGVGRAIAADSRWARKALEAQRQRPR